jgi:glycosyltransferase involved in cell wall biosynthesis
MEAMAMEIPCVTTFITGIPELIRDEVDGLLVAPSDEVALAGALARLMDDVQLRRRLGLAGRQRVIDKYNLGKSVEHLADVFREMLAA